MPEVTALNYEEITKEFYKDTIKTLHDGTKRSVDFGCSINAEPGRLLYDFVRELKPSSTLEIGLAWGGSAIHILCALRDNQLGHHTAVDPMQDSWSGIGISEPTRLGLGDFLTCIPQRSDAALPAFIAEGRRFQFAFIDGDHRFDGAFVDFHFCRQLLDIGGIVFFDDAKSMGVGRAISFVDTNMPNFQRVDINTFGRFAAFRKIDDDRRLFGDEAPF